MLHATMISLAAAAALCSCGTQSSAQPLLSTSRIVVGEQVSVDVFVDVASSADFDVSAASNTLTIAKLSEPGFSITPSCDASHGPDVTYDVVVTAAGRKEALEVVVTNDTSYTCFRHAELAIPAHAGPKARYLQLACADRGGDAGLEVMVSDDTVGWLVSVPPDFSSPSLGPANTSRGTWQQLFAQKTAHGVAIYGVDDTKPDLWVLTDAGWTTTGTSFPMGSDFLVRMVAIRSPAVTCTDCVSDPSCCPDTWAALLQRSGGAVPPLYDVSFAKMDGTPGTAPVPLDDRFAGEVAALTTWNGGRDLAMGAFGATANQNLMTFSPTWPVTGLPDTGNSAVAGRYDGPVYTFAAPIVTIATRSGAAKTALVVASLPDPFTAALDAALWDVPLDPGLPQNVNATPDGGVRSVADTPDGAVLLGADRGTVLSYYDTDTKLHTDLVDLAEQQPTTDPAAYGYGLLVAPCLSRTGAFVGFAAFTSADSVRVAALPGLP